jgi:integrase
MGVTARKKHGKWFVFVIYHGQRKSKCVGDSKAAAEKVKRILEAKLALGDLGMFDAAESNVPTFNAYADRWLKEYAGIECKDSTTDGYEGVLRNYLRPRFGPKSLDAIRRDELKQMIAEMIGKGLSRSTIKNAIAVISGMFNQAIEAGIVQSNPAARLGRFTRAARRSDQKGIALTPAEAERFLEAAIDQCPDYFPLFLTALRAGLRRGELVALQIGDINFGDENDASSRFIVVQHNYVRRKHTTTKSRKTRRVDMSRELRRALLEIRDQRLLAAYQKGKTDITEELVFPSPDGGILDPDNLYHRYFVPVLAAAGIRKIRLHDLRHTFGSLLIQNGASIVYVKEQMGHGSIQVTVDTYGHLIPGANACFVDRLDQRAKSGESNPHPAAPPARLREKSEPQIPSEVVDLIGGGGRTRTYDLRIMRFASPFTPITFQPVTWGCAPDSHFSAA